MYFHYENKSAAYTASYTQALSPAPHVHTHIEMVLLEKGETTATADSVDVKLEPGDLFISFPNQIHYYVDKERPLGGYLIIVSPDMCPEFSRIFKGFLPESPILRGALRNPRIKDAAENLIRLNKEPEEFREITARGYFLILFGEILKALPVAENDYRVSDPVKDIIKYCYENYAGDISLGSVAESLHISPYYVSHLFSKRLKMSFNDYINTLRIRSACEMLKTGEKSITEIAYAVGYNSTRSFDRCFVKIRGLTPKQYRSLKLGKQ